MTLLVAAGTKTRTGQRRIDNIGLALLIWVSTVACRSCSTGVKSSTGSTPPEIVILTIVAVVSLSFLIVWG